MGVLLLMSQRRLFPSVLILVLFSFFLTHFFFLPVWLDEVPPASLPSCWNVTSPKSPAEISLWEMFKRLLASLEVAEVQYYITSGSLLWLARSCSFPGDDIDISVDLPWWRKDGNSQVLEDILISCGLKKAYDSGERREPLWIKGTLFPCVVR